MCDKCKQIKAVADFYIHGRDDPHLFKSLAAYLAASRHLPSRARPMERKQLDRIGEAARLSTKKERQLHNYRFREYGITASEFLLLKQEQEDRCKVCRDPKMAREPRSGRVRDLSIDHDHKTGAIRGLLCWRCNAIIDRMKDIARKSNRNKSICLIASYAEPED